MPGLKTFLVTIEWQLNELLHQHNSVFEDKLGSVKDMKVKLFVEENSSPCFSKPIPSYLHSVIKFLMNFDSFQVKDVIVPVKFSSWPAPVVPVIKRDGIVRLCRDTV